MTLLNGKYHQLLLLVFLSRKNISNSLLSPVQQSGHCHQMKPLATSLRKSNSDDKDKDMNINMRGYDALQQNMISNNIEGEEIYNNEDFNISTKKKKFLSMPSTLCRTLLHRAGEVANNDRKRRELLMTAALFGTYFSVMGAKCALPSTLALVTSDESGLTLQNLDSTPQQIIAKVLTLSTFAIAIGKFFLGPIIDRYGGVLCLKVALSSLMGLLAIISATNSFKTFSIALVCIDFIFSSCWAACLNAVHHSFRQEQWSSCIGVLAVAARIGNASSFFFFASLLQWTQQRRITSGGLIGQSWRNVFWASALMQVFPLILLVAISRDKMNSSIHQNNDLISTANDNDEITALSHAPDKNLPIPSKPSIRKSLQTVKEESRTFTFWMHLLSRSCLMIIASFLLFVPSYMTNAFGLSSAASARVGSIYALGCLLSVSVGSKLFPMMTTRGKVISSIGSLGIVILVSVLQLLFISGSINISALGGTVSMFLWGVGFAVPFYIPPSLYALKKGGKESSATIADAFDFTGFLLLAAFNGFVASRQQEILSTWFVPFIILTVCGTISLVSLVSALIAEGRETNT